MNSSRVISPSWPYCSIRRPTNPTGEAFAATMRSFNSRTEKRGGRVDMSNPVLCESQTPTASGGTPAFAERRVHVAPLLRHQAHALAGAEHVIDKPRSGPNAPRRAAGLDQDR